MDDIANKIEELTHEVNYLYQEGVLFYPSAIKTLEISIANLQDIIKDLKNSKLQSITKQVYTA
jgi:prefoldin subunit 5